MTSELSARECTIRLQGLLGKERSALVEFLLLLGDLEAKKLYVELGYAGVWDYVRRALGQSETMTHYRVTTARLLVRFPQAVAPLEDGRLCMTTLACLAPVITDANCDALLAEAMGKTKTEVLQLKARLDPKPVPKDVVRHAPKVEQGGLGLLVPAQVAEASDRSAAPPSESVRKEVLTESLTRRHLTTDGEFEELLSNARSALSHKMPGASEVELLKEGLREIVRQHEKRKGLVGKPRAPKPRVDPPGGKDSIPAHVMREVWRRDGGVCQWPTSDGGICGSTLRLEFHHLLDRGKGGKHTVANVRLACSFHNQRAADQVWGRDFMRSKRARSAEQAYAPAPPYGRGAHA